MGGENMNEIDKFNSMRELFDYKRYLEKFKLETKLQNINAIILDILSQKKTNKEWLDILLNIINQRKNKYHIETLSGTKENNKWNAYIFVKDNIDITKIGKDEVAGIIYFAPDLFCDYYQDENIILYEAFYFDCKDYLQKEKDLLKFFKKGTVNGLYVSELEQIYEKLFVEYKDKLEERRSGKNVKIRKI